MATRSWRIMILAMSLVLTIWIWVLACVLFALRWNAVERPGPPTKEVFPYGEIRIGVDASYFPFAVATADDLFGLDIDLGQALAKELNIPVRFVNMGYDGLYDSLKIDQVDVLISALLVDYSRTNEVRYTLPYYNAGLMLVRDYNTPIQSMLDLPGHSLAYEFGSDADLTAHIWMRRIQSFQTHPYELPEYALDAARLGISDAALVDATSAYLYLRSYSEWKTYSNYITDVLYAIAVRIDRGATYDAINGALALLIEDGTVQAIIDRWL